MIYISLLFKLSFKKKKVDWTGLDSIWTGLDSSPVKAIFWVESIWSPVESSGVHMDSGGDCKVLAEPRAVEGDTYWLCTLCVSVKPLGALVDFC